MGVVDEHRVGRRHRHHLHPALDPGNPSQGPGRLVHGQPQGQAAGQDPQGVVNSKAAGNGQGHRTTALGPVDLKGHPVGVQPDLPGQHLGLALGLPKGHRLAGRCLGKLPSRPVVQVKNARLTLLEQQALGLAIGLHGPVKIQVVPGEVGENPRLEPQPRRPAQGQGVGGNLHHHMGAPRLLHPGQQALEGIGIRRGPLGGEGLLANEVLVGADETHLGLADRLQHPFQQICGGGLSIGAGDPHQGHPVPWAAKPVGGHLTKGPPGIGGQQPGAGTVRGLGAEHRRRPPVQRLLDKLGSVCLLPPEGGKEAAGGNRSAVAGERSNFHVPTNLVCQGDAPDKPG